MRQTSCPGHFAVVRLRLELDFGADAVIFVNRLRQRSPDWFVAGPAPAEPGITPAAVGEPFASEVVEGVKEVLAALSPDGSPIQALKVSLLEMRVHPIDSQLRDFRRAAILAVTEAIQNVGLTEGPA